MSRKHRKEETCGHVRAVPQDSLKTLSDQKKTTFCLQKVDVWQRTLQKGHWNTHMHTHTHTHWIQRQVTTDRCPSCSIFKQHVIDFRNTLLICANICWHQIFCCCSCNSSKMAARDPNDSDSGSDLESFANLKISDPKKTEPKVLDRRYGFFRCTHCKTNWQSSLTFLKSNKDGEVFRFLGGVVGRRWSSSSERLWRNALMTSAANTRVEVGPMFWDTSKLLPWFSEV